MNKEKNMKLNLNPYFESTIETSSVVWSHDENSYQFNFDFTEYLCDKPFDLTDGKPRILLEFLNDKNAEVQIYPLIIDSEKLGVAHFIIPDKILGYVGDVKASLTIDFSNKSYDLGNFSFRMKKSPIDNKMPQLQFYVDEFEKAIEKANELNTQIKDRDLVTKPELASVDNRKADKTALNSVSLQLLDKADKSDVNTIKNEINNKADKKTVDSKINELTKDLSNTQIGLIGEFNSESELKEKYPNGTNGYAVVFENSVGYTYTYKNNVWTKGNVWNGMAIADDSVNSKKRTVNGEKAFLFIPLDNKKPNFDTTKNTLTFYKGTIIFYQKENPNGKTYFELSEDVSLDLSSIDSTAKLIKFDIDNNVFTLGHYGSKVRETEIVVTTGRYTKGICEFDLGVKHTINGELDTFPDNSISSDKLIKDSVTTSKRTVKGERAFLIVPDGNKFPSVNTRTQVITFFKDTIICFQKDNAEGKAFYILPTDLSIDLSKVDSSTKVLRFNIDTKEILAGHHGTKLKENEIILTTGRLAFKYGYFDLGVPYVVDGALGTVFAESLQTSNYQDWSVESRKRTVKGEKAFIILNGKSEYPNFDTAKKTLTFYPDTIIYHQKFATDKRTYHVISEELTIDLNTASTTKLIKFNIDEKTFSIGAYSDHLKENECIISTGRVAGSVYAFDLGVPYTVDKKLPWKDDQSQSGASDLLLNTFDDYLRCGHHRGQNIDGPENTLAAYRLSKKQGTSIVEMDINFTKDNVPINLHDPTINRTARNADGSKFESNLKITEITFEEVRKYDFGIFKGEEFKGEKIPTFEEIVKLIRTLDMHLYIDRASLINTDERRAEIKRVLDKYDAWYNVTFMCVYSHADKLLELKPKLNFMYVADDFQEIGITELVRLKEKGATGRYMANAKNITDEQIKQIQSKGVDIEFWNCYEDTDYQKYIDLGIRGFQTDGYNFKQLLIDKKIV